MDALWLRVRAPFAAFRPMQAGAYRSTAPVMTPSAAYGLILNLAGVESRSAEPGPVTRTRSELPPLAIAIGLLSEPGISSLYQQLHGYPVGSSGKDLAVRTHGAKYWIAPVRREVLVDLDVAVGVRSPNAALVERVGRGLRGEMGERRYGLPFAGDNNFLIDRIEALAAAPTARWYERLLAGASARPGTCRLTIGIDREDSSRTTSGAFAHTSAAGGTVPEAAWTWVPRAPA